MLFVGNQSELPVIAIYLKKMMFTLLRKVK